MTSQDCAGVNARRFAENLWQLGDPKSPVILGAPIQQMTQRVPATHTWTVDYSGSVRAQLSSQFRSTSSAGVQINSRQFRRYTASGNGMVASSLNIITPGAFKNTSADEELIEQTSLGLYLQELVAWRERHRQVSRRCGSDARPLQQDH